MMWTLRGSLELASFHVVLTCPMVAITVTTRLDCPGDRANMGFAPFYRELNGSVAL